jgi:hypothetical protein
MEAAKTKHKEVTDIGTASASSQVLSANCTTAINAKTQAATAVAQGWRAPLDRVKITP